MHIVSLFVSPIMWCQNTTQRPFQVKETFKTQTRLCTSQGVKDCWRGGELLVMGVCRPRLDGHVAGMS